MDDWDIAVQFTNEFLQDISGYMKRAMMSNAQEICRQHLEEGSIYLLFHEDVPVSMTWKRRALRDGCSIAYVYTPEAFRHQGFGGACVSLCTELFLKEYQYVTLFVKRSQDPHHNMYTNLGYELIGEVGRYAIILFYDSKNGWSMQFTLSGGVSVLNPIDRSC